MTLFLSNRDGNGKTSEEGHYKFPVNAFVGNVLQATDLQVTQLDTIGMGVKISPGTFRIPDVSGNFAYTGWNDANTNVTITTADPANPRLSAIVIYIDKNAATSASPVNNPGIAKFMAVNGTPASSPVIPNGTTIQAAVGSGNPYIILASARVNAAGTTVPNANIIDLRVRIALAPGLMNTDALLDNSITGVKLVDAIVSTAKLINGAATTSKVRPNYVVQAGSTGTTSRQSFSAPNTVYSIQGSSFTYTSGSTNELLDIDANALINPGTHGDGLFYIAVNGTPVSRAEYMGINNTWITCKAKALYPIAANTTVTIDSRFRTGGTTTTAATVCNSTGDQSSSPSYGQEVRLIAWGRT